MTGAAATHSPRATRGPVQRSERAVAPDLARGAMLLLIALANSAGVVFASAPGIETAPYGPERAYNVFMFVFVHARGLPMFAFMFGYGLVQLARRQEAAGGTARAVLLRRNAWLIAFGTAHATLLYSGDILGAYGLMGIVITLALLRRSERVRRLVLWLWALMVVYVAVLAAVAGWGIAHSSDARAPVPLRGSGGSLEATTYVGSLTDRMAEWPVHTISVVGLIPIAWLGAWAARRRVLEDPANHLRLLRTTAVVGIGIAVAGGLPMALLSVGLLRADEFAASSVRFLYEVSGQFGGIGYVALFGLLALALTKARRDPTSFTVVGALTALGQRSLSGYLFQSVAWLVLLSPFTLALGAKAASPTFAAAGCAVGVWLVTVIGAYLMQRYGFRGPAEVLLRRLTYGRPARRPTPGGP